MSYIPSLRGVAHFFGQVLIFAFALVLAGIVGVAGVAFARNYMSNATDIFNESSLKKPGNVQLKRRAVTTGASVALTDLASASEVAVWNLYDADLCVKVVASGTCTATCTGDYIEIPQDQAVAIPLPKGAGIAGTYGTACGILRVASSNSEAVQTIERDQ